MIHWGEVTAVFGGTFDPPHWGHIEAVKGLFNTPGVKRVVIVPSALPPLKIAVSPAEQRLAMVRLSFDNLEGVEISTFEIDAGKSGNPSYTFDTLQRFNRDYKEIAFTIGTDQLQNLHRWHRFPELLKECHWIVLKRQGFSDSDSLLATLKAWQQSNLISGLMSSPQGEVCDIKGSNKKMVFVATQAPHVSSTELRENFAKMDVSELIQKMREWMPSSVAEYLKQNHLYGINLGETK